jgi:hypothetical protein
MRALCNYCLLAALEKPDSALPQCQRIVLDPRRTCGTWPLPARFAASTARAFGLVPEARLVVFPYAYRQNHEHIGTRLRPSHRRLVRGCDEMRLCPGAEFPRELLCEGWPRSITDCFRKQIPWQTSSKTFASKRPRPEFIGL